MLPLTIESLRRSVEKAANETGVAIAIGWQYDEFADDGKSLGWCPTSAVGPAFVYEVLEVVYPRNI